MKEQNKTAKIAPSLLSCDFANLQSQIELCQDNGADYIHVDVMDGHFVPNITIGPLIVKAIKPYTTIPIDCHLMIENPDKYIEDFAKAGADMISVHAEAVNHLHRSLSLIKSYNCKAGFVLNPLTPLEYAYEALNYTDFILLMSVNPGFGGQSFIDNFYRRCSNMKEFLIKNGLEHIDIEVDGGIKIENARKAVEVGASILVSGSGLFKGDFISNIKEMKKEIDFS